MRGQTKNVAQQATVDRLRAKGWREGDMFALQVPMYYDRPFVGLPRPHVVHIDRRGKVHAGYARKQRCYHDLTTPTAEGEVCCRKCRSIGRLIDGMVRWDW